MAGVDAVRWLGFTLEPFTVTRGVRRGQGQARLTLSRPANLLAQPSSPLEQAPRILGLIFAEVDLQSARTRRIASSTLARLLKAERRK